MLALFAQDNWLILQLEVAYKLKKTYAEVLNMTEQELILWSLFFQYKNQRRLAAQKGAP